MSVQIGSCDVGAPDIASKKEGYLKVAAAKATATAGLKPGLYKGKAKKRSEDRPLRKS